MYIIIVDRLCIFCNNNSIESEIHFLLECPFYNTIRTSLLNDPKIQSQTIDHLKSLAFKVGQSEGQPSKRYSNFILLCRCLIPILTQLQSGLRCGTPYTFTVVTKSGYEWSDVAVIHTVTGN